MIDQIHSSLSECFVQLRLEGRRVLRVDDCVYIERERDRSIAELVDAVVGVEPARHADLVDALSERADVRQHIDVAGARQLRGELAPPRPDEARAEDLPAPQAA